jgi:hypothetical protein
MITALASEISARSPELRIGSKRTCSCPANHLNRLTAKERIKAQLDVCQFYYERRDVRGKELRAPTYPIFLARKCIDLFPRKEELILGPPVGSTVVAPGFPGQIWMGRHAG